MMNLIDKVKYMLSMKDVGPFMQKYSKLREETSPRVTEARCTSH